jgi:hypothetical protein
MIIPFNMYLRSLFRCKSSSKNLTHYIKSFNLMTIPTKDELFDFLLDHNSLKVK